MSNYRNGQIPLTDMLPLRTGWDSNGYWEHRLPAGSYRRWLNMVEDVRNATGVTLRITEGWNAYRPLDAQWTAYRKSAPGNAAYPGTSSHGGVYNGRDAMAIDVANWGQIGQARFYEFARKHGFTPGVFSWEPWHLFDYNPWVAPAGGGAVPFPTPEPKPKPEPPISPEEDEEMVFYAAQDDGQAPDKGRVFEVFRDPRNGELVKRHINYAGVWQAIRESYVVSGQKLPLVNMSALNLDKLPTWKK